MRCTSVANQERAFWERGTDARDKFMRQHNSHSKLSMYALQCDSQHTIRVPPQEVSHQRTTRLFSRRFLVLVLHSVPSMTSTPWALWAALSTRDPRRQDGRTASGSRRKTIGGPPCLARAPTSVPNPRLHVGDFAARVVTAAVAASFAAA